MLMIPYFSQVFLFFTCCPLSSSQSFKIVVAPKFNIVTATRDLTILKFFFFKKENIVSYIDSSQKQIHKCPTKISPVVHVPTKMNQYV
jgi:hypothetical protein